MKLLKPIDKLLNEITMYRLLIYGLSLLLAGAIVLGVIGALPISPAGIMTSLIVLVATCYIANRSLAILWGTTSNTESWLITALILCLILPPSKGAHQLAIIGLAGLIAMASKFIVARYHKHLFNPAAFAAVVVGVSILLPATWWIGSPSMLLFTLVFGFLVLRKVRRFQLFFSFLISSLLIAVVVGSVHDQTIGYIITSALKSSPLIFLGSIMLTEPETTPPLLWQQYIYGLIVGAIFTSQLRLGSISATPEIALILGNIYSYVISPKYKLNLKLKSKRQLAPRIYDFGFTGASNLKFKPGQYMEWTLPGVDADRRGNRRVFSIASAPGEEEIHIAIKISNRSSSYKKTLVTLESGDSIIAGQLTGDFTLPNDKTKKLSFIAGGIGITPFVSMAKAMIKEKQRRNIVLFYLVADPTELCYQGIWKEASKFGLRIVPVLTDGKLPNGWRGLSGRLCIDNIQKELPDYSERRFYISGPDALVENYNELLLKLGVKRQHVITDHFSGY